MTKESLKKIIGENIRNQRAARNMSIDELAELLELTSGFVGLIERGQRGATPYTLYKLSIIFDIDIDKLFEKDAFEALKVSEDSHVIAKRTKIKTIIYDLNEAELDFVISTIKNLKNMQNTITGEGSTDDDENDVMY